MGSVRLLFVGELEQIFLCRTHEAYNIAQQKWCQCLKGSKLFGPLDLQKVSLVEYDSINQIVLYLDTGKHDLGPRR